MNHIIFFKAVRLLIVYSFLWSSQLFAQSDRFFVDGNHAGASDSNPGTEAEPWKTIQKAATNLTAGDTVYIKAGTYNESVSVAHSGTADKYIVFSAFPGDSLQVIISSTFTIPGKSYIKVRGLRRDLGNVGFRVDGPSTGVILEGNYTYGTRSSGISIWGVPWGANPGNYDNITNIIIKNNIVEKACDGGWNECITLANGVKGFQLIYNEVKNGGDGTNGGEGIDIKEGCSNGIIANNHIHHLSRRGIYLDGGRNMNYYDYARPIVENIHIYGNRVHHQSGGGGFAIMTEGAGYVRNIYIYNNLFYSNPSDGIMYYLHPEGAANNGLIYNITAVNNVCYKNGRNGILSNFRTSYNMIIRNNISYDNSSTDLWLQSGENVADHNLVGIDPSFVDAAGADFHLQEGSLAIDSGSVSLAPGGDYDGMVRPFGNGVDIGAFEYGSTVPALIKFALTVVKGAGSGTYDLFETVEIIADDAPEGYKFKEWTGDVANVADVKNDTTTVVIPGNDITVTATYIIAMPPGNGTGSILRERWKNIRGVDVSKLTSNSNYPDNPTSRFNESTFEAPTKTGDNYGTRMRGYLHPSLDGSYTFWISSKNAGELWLSKDENPDSAKIIAYVSSEGTAPQDWDDASEPNQKTASIELEADSIYYIEALQKAGIGGEDNLSVAWQLENSVYEREIIEGQYLSPGQVSKINSEIYVSKIPSATRLIGNYPNPFNPSTQINYVISKSGFVTLKIYDVIGREIAVLANGNKSPGEYIAIWNAKNFPSGIYYYRLQTGDFTDTKKLVLQK